VILTIKARLILIAGLFVLSSLAGLFVLFHSLNKQAALEDARFRLQKIETDILDLRRNEKDFLQSKSLDFVHIFQQDAKSIQKEITALSDLFDAFSFDASKLQKTAHVIQRYEHLFNKVVQHQTRLGLDHKSGLYGDLRHAIHQAEKEFKLLGYHELLVDMLTLRRNEKDFMLRGLLTYVERFHTNHTTLLHKVEKLSLNTVQKQQIKTNLIRYRTAFDAFTTEKQTLGLTLNDALLGELEATFETIELHLLSSIKSLNQTTTQEVRDIKSVNTTLVILMTSFVTFILMMAVRAIQRKVSSLQTLLSKIAREKDLTVALDNNDKDEIGKMRCSMYHLIKAFKEVLQHLARQSSETAAVSAELSRTSEQIGKRAQEEQARIQSAVEHNTRINQSLTLSTDKIKTAQGDIHHASKELSSVRTLIVRLIQSVSETSERESALAEQLEQLNRDADQVKQILTVISDIADQTNLLMRPLKRHVQENMDEALRLLLMKYVNSQNAPSVASQRLIQLLESSFNPSNRLAAQ